MGLESFTPPYRIHLGCNTTKFGDFVNVDARETPATDIVHDCSNLSIFPDESATLIFAHAFFEHLRRDQRVPLLADIKRVLAPNGCVFFCGIPDFEMVARCYLGGVQGNVSPVFNLFEVYRYTHGDPEHQPEWWLEQLHKSLFDLKEVQTLLREAGFLAPCIFRYTYHTEPNPVNLAFVAAKNNQPIPQDFLTAIVEMFAPIYGHNPITVLSA